MKNDMISRNFTYSEFERSDTAALHGIDNTIPDDRIRRAVRLLVRNVLQPLRDAMRVPLHINSGYRSSALNTLLRGARNSQHTKGEAADTLLHIRPHLPQAGRPAERTDTVRQHI